jgi:indolepyruvate ferredoxin oxidoreductase alpha subunit
MKMLLTGDEAVARGAWEAGVRFASAYPGTPSTEILEALAGYDEVHAEWAPNEKTALESAIGASMAGARSMASMKHVGVNVAADPLMTFSYMGVNGGAVLVTADEPGMFSSQNEQDNRNYAKMGRIPMFEPADSQDCLDMMKEAFDFSEKYNVVVMVRMVTRVCHSKSLVETGVREEFDIKEWAPNPLKYVALPAISRKLRMGLDARDEAMRRYGEASPFNRIEEGGQVGVIASGPSYFYAKEVFGNRASYLRLGFTYPMPVDLISKFCEGREEIYVVEEDDPYIEETVQRLGFKCHGKDVFPSYGEMTPDVLRKALYGETLPTVDLEKNAIIGRPPALCAGCPHRGLFYRLGKRKDIMISGDIGCYTLAAGAPYKAMNTTVCMGASLSVGHGAQKVFQMKGENRKVVAVIGDSTFFHTGINSLINTVYNNSNTVNIILDNRTTGMTGHQDNPGTGFTAEGDPTNMIVIEDLVKALGIKHVKVINPNDLAEVDAALDEFIDLDEPSVIITRYPCALKRFSDTDLQEFDSLFTGKNRVDEEKCIGCRRCQGTGCPALIYDKSQKKVNIDSTCVGCDVCSQVCPTGAIVKEGKDE